MSDKKGIILMFLSCDRFNNPDRIYRYVRDGIEQDAVYEGIQTGDAPVRCLLSAAEEEEVPVEKIICIVTDEDLQATIRQEPVNREGVSTLDRFRMIVEDWFKTRPAAACPKILPVRLRKDLASRERTRILYREILEIIGPGEAEEETHVYLDYTGGFRDVSYLMIAIIQYLEFRGISCSRIIYSDPGKRKIYDLGYLYSMSDLISGVSEFLSTGNAVRLLQTGDRSAPEKETWIGTLIRKIISFSDALMLCDMQRLSKAAEEVCICLDNEPEGETDQDLYHEMLLTLVPEIRKKLHLKEGRVSYPGLIRWCLDNRMVQQAVTLYVEKMPSFYFSDEATRKQIPKEALEQADEAIRSGGTGDTSGDNPDAEAFYTVLFKYMGQDLLIEEFRKEVCRLSEDANLLINPSASVLRSIRRQSEPCKKALRLLAAFVEKEFEGRTATCPVYKKVISLNLLKKDRSDSAAQFLKKLSASPAGLFTFLYPEKKYEKTGGKAATYRTKYADLSGQRARSCPEIRKKMLYYLAAKLIRNRMNHASDRETGDEKEVIRQLKNEGIVFDGTIESINRILREGLALSG